MHQRERMASDASSVKLTVSAGNDKRGREIAYQIMKRIRELVRQDPIIVHLPGGDDFILSDIGLSDV